MNDPGCTMRRDGQLPMDATSFSGVMQSLEAVSNELTRLDVAREAAPHVVNPQHSLGFSSKWKNSLSGEEYVELMSAQ